MSGFTDIHSHFIYGIDDGAKSREVMEAMLDAAYEDNIRTLISTPHATPGIEPFQFEAFTAHFKEAEEYCYKMGYDIRLMPGAENLYTPALPGYTDSHGLVSLAGSEYVLIEFIPDAELKEIRYAVDFLCRRGYIPVLAHVERYKNLSFKEARKLNDEYELIFQMNCSTVAKTTGFLEKIKVNKYLESGLISCIACDAHNCSSRRFNMTEAYRVLKNKYGSHIADKLTGKKAEYV